MFARVGNFGSVCALLQCGAPHQGVRGRVTGEAFVHSLSAGGLVSCLEELISGKLDSGISVVDGSRVSSILLDLDGRGWTPILYAAAAGREATVLWILDQLEKERGRWLDQSSPLEEQVVIREARKAMHVAAEYGQPSVVNALISRFVGDSGALPSSTCDSLLNTPVKLGTEEDIKTKPRTALARALGTHLCANGVRIYRLQVNVEDKNIIAAAEAIRAVGGGWIHTGDAALQDDVSISGDFDQDDAELGSRVAQAFESLCTRSLNTHRVVEHMLAMDGGVRRVCRSNQAAAGRILRAMAASDGLLNGSSGDGALKLFAGLAQIGVGLGVPQADANAALHLACESGLGAVHEALLILVHDLGADVKAAVDLEDGHGPLAVVHRGHGLSFLITEFGADPTAVASGVHSTTGLSWQRNALHGVRAVDDAQAVRNALATTLGPDVFPHTWAGMLRAPDVTGWEPLHYCVDCDDNKPWLPPPELVAWLLSEMRSLHGAAGVRAMANARTVPTAAVSSIDRSGGVPVLMIAASSKDHSRELLSVPEIDPASTTTDIRFGGGSALHALVVRGIGRYHQIYLTEMARTLVAAGVPVAARDIEGKTAAEVADRMGFAVMASILRNLEARMV
ncbi:hypothetical protein HK405_004010 [Cladochytrium tenue]|nr:hypothetical protein HK405_004010 [Cladochytrium tenue]